MANAFVRKIVDDQARALETAREKCIEKYGVKSLVEVLEPIYNETAKKCLCPAFWDGILCWPDTPPGVLATEQCPEYVAGFSSIGNATRQCMSDGVWFHKDKTWTDYTNCSEGRMATIFVNLNHSNQSDIIREYIPMVKAISLSGYIVSLVTLLIAFTTMVSIRKLHCSRNILHMHLFASFIFRAIIYLVKQMAFVEGLGLPSDLQYFNDDLYFSINVETNSNWKCKLVASLWQYFNTANYFWILMEGLYLHNLIFRALFADSNNRIKWYIIMGWGLPLIAIFLWITTRILTDDNFCWTTQGNQIVFLSLAVPTTISILINLVLFMRISMVLYVKLKSPINEDSQRYKKWVKSTLVLVPLFGVHYALLVSLYWLETTNKVVKLVWLIADKLFGSFQGFFVAILYCFLNGEVKAEIQPYVNHLLTYLATNRYSKRFFPCRKKFLRKVVGSTSVSTTMSCSSLYMNGVLHRNSKTRLDSLPKGRPQSFSCLCYEDDDKTKHHVCNGTKILHEPLKRHSRSHIRCNHQNELQRHPQVYNFSRGVNTTETALCLGNHPEKCLAESGINEETIRMIIPNNF